MSFRQIVKIIVDSSEGEVRNKGVYGGSNYVEMAFRLPDSVQYFHQACVGRRSVHDHVILIEEANSALKVEFDSDGHDIGFALLRRASAKGNRIFHHIPLNSMRKRLASVASLSPKLNITPFCRFGEGCY